MKTKPISLMTFVVVAILGVPLLPASSEEFEPDLGNRWKSTFGDIHWRDGYYSVPNNTLTIKERGWDEASEEYIIRGNWGRGDNPSNKGTFLFRFRTPFAFLGWYKNEGSDTPTPWEGTAIREFTPDLTKVWNSSYGEIHWSEGWYGDPDKRIKKSTGVWNARTGEYVVQGTWSRASDSTRKGEFEFRFKDPKSFTGNYTNAGGTVGQAWSGTIKE